MLKIFGTSALSDFRTQQLLLKLQAVTPVVQAVSAQFVHFVETTRDLTDNELKTLERVLAYGHGDTLPDVQGEKLLVVPRAGTISPWSSKATDIAQHCGLAAVQRVDESIYNV